MIMEKDNTENRSKIVLAIILIAVGIFWFIGQINMQFHIFAIFKPLWGIFSHIGRIVFSWPMILMLVGLILLAGNRSGGWVLIILGGIFLLPRIFMFPHFPFTIIFPLILILVGGAMIIKRI
jgi:hypothetical protein